MKIINMVGMKFGELLVIEQFSKNSRSMCVCKCSCGNTITVFAFNLKKGNTKSCHGKGLSLITHNRYKHPCYSSWRAMMNRCNNKNSSDYTKYGAKGIVVSESWKDIENFISDMGCPPSNKHTIDRIDNSKGYYKDNCRWANRKEQVNNRSVSILVEGIPLKEWALVNNIPYNVAWNRYSKGWDAYKIKNTPIICRYADNQKCCVNGCNNKVKTKKMCNKHYLRWWKSSKS